MPLEQPDRDMVARYILQGAASLDMARQVLVAKQEDALTANLPTVDDLYAHAKLVNPSMA